MRLPNFLIIGAHKAGTTSLFNYLKPHPEVFVPELKEARFFAFKPDDPDYLKKGSKAYPITTINQYSALFDTVKDEKAIGEASPNYLTSMHAAEKIHKYIPKVKLIASLRNPIDRVYSLYLMALRSNGSSKMKIGDFKFSNYLKQSYYYPKLKCYFDLFDKAQIKIILFEDLINNSEATVKEIYVFLNISDTFLPDTTAIYNQGGIPKSVILDKFARNKKFKKLLRTYLPTSTISTLRNMKNNNLQKAPKLSSEERAEAIELVKPDIHKTEDLIQRDLSSWYEL